MRTTHFSKGSRERTHILIFETGDSVVSAIEDYVVEQEIQAARFTAIGALQACTLAFFDWETKDYQDIPVNEQTEVLVLAGDIAWHDGKPVVHAHAVLGKPDGSTVGGHLKEARVRPTLELFMDEHGALKRKRDSESGLALIDPDAIKAEATG